MPETDPENGDLAEQPADGIDAPGHGLGVSGAVGEKDAVGLLRQGVGCRRACGNHGHSKASVGEGIDDVALDAEVVRDHRSHGGTFGFSDVRLFRGHL